MATFSVLGFARLQTEPAPFEIDVRLLARQDFRAYTPARQIRCLNDGPQDCGQLSYNGPELICFEEALSSIVFSQKHDMGSLHDLLASLAEDEHPAKASELAIDRRISGSLFLAVDHVTKDTICCNL